MDIGGRPSGIGLRTFWPMTMHLIINGLEQTFIMKSYVQPEI
jgi:hypothetical protein